jgi:hypothetical protein
MLKGLAVALVVCIVALVGLIIAARGTVFDVKIVTNAAQFVMGLGLGTTVVGAGLWLLGRLALTYLTRRMAG